MTQDQYEGRSFVTVPAYLVEEQTTSSMNVAAATERLRIVKYLREQINTYVWEMTPVKPEGVEVLTWLHNVIDSIERNEF